jgi:hypothetical protein
MTGRLHQKRTNAPAQRVVLFAPCRREQSLLEPTSWFAAAGGKQDMRTDETFGKVSC